MPWKSSLIGWCHYSSVVACTGPNILLPRYKDIWDWSGLPANFSAPKKWSQMLCGHGVRWISAEIEPVEPALDCTSEGMASVSSLNSCYVPRVLSIARNVQSSDAASG